MAKKTSGNKTQTILDYKAQNPDAKPKAISEALQAQGHSITPGYVSTILSKSRSSRGTKKRGTKKRSGGVSAPRAVATKKRSSSSTGGGKEVSVDVLMKVRDLVQSTGGVDEVRRALDTYAKLTD